MESPCHGIAAVISKLQLPASLSLTLRCTDVDEDSVQALSNALNSAWVSLPLSSPHSSPPQLPLEQLDVTQWNRRVLHLGGAAFHSAPGQPNIVASFSISYVIPRDQVGFPGLEGLRMWTPALTRLALAPWPLTQVESLSVSSRTLGLTATGVLKEVLSKPFPSVTSIEAELDAVRQLHDFLSTDPGLPLSTLAVPQTPGSVVSEGQQQGPSFPQLKELTFTKILTLDYEKVIELKDVLLSRAQCGSPLETLHISQCPGFPREVVNAFKTVVPCVLFT
ncbi:hypothetical protein CC2G_009944 [Coprinopsis cinerea AmutBmut pab1-1]|nr:hypothetical protein CC2G_009944 [Coprinopsis cinerea AmutBmut pab1-1]